MNENSELIEMRIGALIMDPNTNSPIVVLKGIESETVLPIWVGAFEANAIALEIEKIAPQRPMTHDLLKNLVIACGLSASKVVVTDLVDNTFFARIELSDEDGQPVVFDARPSDAIALALRLDCPIFVESRVLELSATSTKSGDTPADDEEGDQPIEEWPEVIG